MSAYQLLPVVVKLYRLFYQLFRYKLYSFSKIFEVFNSKTIRFDLQILKNRLISRIRALVVLPTKDLAFQVFKVFKQYIDGTNLKAICLGNTTLEKEKNKLISSGK